MGYVSIAAGLFCAMLAILEFCRLENTKQLNLFWDVFLAGLNFYCAARIFGWL